MLLKNLIQKKVLDLATYAMWWIKAAIQEYVLRSLVSVKIGTTAVKKNYFLI